jgi:predicted RNA-binding Zn-ribbon protein involved in translation (DUF1610 family)
MKPILIIGPGSSRLRYSIEPTNRRIVVTCPGCGATAIAAETGQRDVTTMVEHQPDCGWLASLKDARNGSIH